jgi:hypothetical protein
MKLAFRSSDVRAFRWLVAAEYRCQPAGLGGLTGVTLDREDIEAIAQRLVQLVDSAANRTELVGDDQVAPTEAWIYQ